MSQELVVMSSWASMQEAAQVFVRSGMLPKSINTPEKAIVIMLQGRELGIGAMQAFNGINVISGKATISPQLMLALIENSGKLEDIQIDSQDTYCTVTMKRIGRSPHSETFTIEDAKRIKTIEYIDNEKKTIALAEKYNWKQMPAVMLKWRAIAACSRIVFPDIIIGMYTPEEIAPDSIFDAETGEVLSVVTEEKKPLEATSPTPTPTNAKPPYKRPMHAVNLREFVKKRIADMMKLGQVSDAICSEEEAKTLAIEWGETLGHKRKKRLSVASYLINDEIASFNELSEAECSVLGSWMRSDVQSAHAEAESVWSVMSDDEQIAPGPEVSE